jgi:hypothetical protein
MRVSSRHENNMDMIISNDYDLIPRNGNIIKICGFG